MTKLPKNLVQIEELEKKYYNIYLEILQKKEAYIKHHFDVFSKRLPLASEWGKENPIERGCQEVMRSIFFRETKYEVYMLPAASDTSFETEDAIIHIDSKTIKFGDNRRDDLDVIIPSPNQSTYPGIYEFNSLPFKPRLPQEYDNKVYLTFFVRCIWDFVNDTSDLTKREEGIKIFEMTLDSIPNGQLKSIYGNLIKSVKTYKYIKNLDGKPEKSECNSTRFTMDPDRINPRLTSGWTRRTKIFDW